MSYLDDLVEATALCEGALVADLTAALADTATPDRLVDPVKAARRISSSVADLITARIALDRETQARLVATHGDGACSNAECAR